MVNEFCCGCSLRTGTLILLWSVLVLESFHFLITLQICLVQNHETKNEHIQHSNSDFTDSNIYQLLISSLAIAISLLGIWAVQKKIPKLLYGILAYFWYRIVKSIYDLIVFASSDSRLNTTMHLNWELYRFYFNLTKSDMVILLIFDNIFYLALLIYFIIVIKSHRDEIPYNSISTKKYYSSAPRTSDALIMA